MTRTRPRDATWGIETVDWHQPSHTSSKNWKAKLRTERTEKPRTEPRTGTMKANPWITYRTRFLVKANNSPPASLSPTVSAVSTAVARATTWSNRPKAFSASAPADLPGHLCTLASRRDASPRRNLDPVQFATAVRNSALRRDVPRRNLSAARHPEAARDSHRLAPAPPDPQISSTLPRPPRPQPWPSLPLTSNAEASSKCLL